MFPEYTFKKYLFGIFAKKIPDGWEDAGLIGEYDRYERKQKRGELHPFCNTYLRIGREEGKAFKYCPYCLVKIDTITD